MSGAGEALQAAAMAALGAIEGLGVYEGQPLQAAFPYAVAETGPEADWSHKSGQGRDIRLAIILHDKGERPARLRTLVAEAEEVLSALGGEMEGWRLVTMPFLRSRLVRDMRSGTASGQGWTAMIEYRARMLRTH